MPEYLSPGVYVEEVPSAVKPITGVSTSTACFIGYVPDTIYIPYENPNYDPTRKSAAPPFLLRQFPSTLPKDPIAGSPEDKALNEFKLAYQKLVDATDPSRPGRPVSGTTATADDYQKLQKPVRDYESANPQQAALAELDVNEKTLSDLGFNDPQNLPAVAPDALKDEDKAKFNRAKAAVDLFRFKYPDLIALREMEAVKGDYEKFKDPNNPDQPKPDAADADIVTFRKAKAVVDAYKAKYPYMADAGDAVLCTTFGDFTRSFGGFSTDGLPESQGSAPTDPTKVLDAAKNPKYLPGGKLTDLPGNVGLQNQLAHAVFGFFNNGGTRCYVMRFKNIADLRDPLSLAPLEAIDEISIIAAPGIVDSAAQNNIVTHCENLTSRFAILDPPVLDDGADMTKQNIRSIQVDGKPEEIGNSDYAALYFPWIKVFDKATQIIHPDGDGEILCAPSGHLAGIYSRVDHERGVHKAPANEVIRGALELDHDISRNLQDGLNPYGINCIRNINDNITVWGARTVGGDANADLKYINVRRTLIFLRESIDRGTQWVVFEPNDRSLWQKIVRNVTAFLTGVWRDGALFGSTPQEAFFVKCDDETNPPEDRDLGKVTTEIGVAIVRPAEFVIFRISQWAGPTGQ